MDTPTDHSHPNHPPHDSLGPAHRRVPRNIHADELLELDDDFDIRTAGGKRVVSQLPSHSLRPRVQPVKTEEEKEDDPVKKQRGNKVVFERRDNKLGFGRLVARPETIVAASMASSDAPAESAIPLAGGMALPQAADRGRTIMPDYRPNRLNGVLDSIYKHSPMRWLDFVMDGRLRVLLFTVTLTCIGLAVAWRYFGAFRTLPWQRAAPMVTRSTEVRVADAHAAVTAFLGASSAEDRLGIVLDTDRVKPRLLNFYQSGRKGPAIKKFTVGNPAGRDGQAWLPVTFTEENDTQFTVALEEVPGGYRLDWENFVAYAEMDWVEYCSRRAPDTVAHRVRARPSTTFVTGYSQAHHDAYELEHRNGEYPVLAYVEKNVRTGARLREVILPGKWNFVHLYVRFPTTDPAGPLIIEDIVQSSWTDSQTQWSRPGDQPEK